MALPKVSFISMRNGKEFNDYYLQISNIFSCTENLIMLDEVLNIPNTIYSDGYFNLSGEGYGGFKVSLRMPKHSPMLMENEIVEFIQNALNKVSHKLKQS